MGNQNRTIPKSILFLIITGALCLAFLTGFVACDIINDSKDNDLHGQLVSTSENSQKIEEKSSNENNATLEEGFLLYQEDEFSKSLVETFPEQIPAFWGEDYAILNGNMPQFTSYDASHMTGEFYSDLDELGRCGCVYAMLDRDMRPTEERGKIGHIKPTGWVQNKYEGVVESSPPYLYNRSHLIAFALTGQNDNEKNLITGTRYFNSKTMLYYEEKVMRYLDNSENHVMYRVTPLFYEDELLARGVEMEAYSVEDHGTGVCFHVFVYNYQPGIQLDYKTGENCLEP